MQLNGDVNEIDRLRADLVAADFSVDAVGALWGEEASQALHRGQRIPATRALDARRLRSAESGDPLATLAKVFVLNLPVSASELAAALPTLGVVGAEQLGLVEREATSNDLRPLLDLRPYSFVDALGACSWWIASDLGEVAVGHALREDHVLGIGGASTTLSQLMIQTRVESALDLGTGCGIQALHASRHAARVIATDISPRALVIARFNADLNGVDNIEFRMGDLFEPVADERFDQIVSNPPFVITPRSEGVPAYEYRDGGMVGDALVEAVVEGVAEHLAPGGIAQFLGNWEYHRHSRRGDSVSEGGSGGERDIESDTDAFDRVAGWLDSPRAAALDAWVIERDVQSAAEYAETWIRDGGTRPGSAEFDRLYSAWLDDFDARDVTQVGFGYVLLRAPRSEPDSELHAVSAHAEPRIRRLERLHRALGNNGAGLGVHIAQCLSAHDWQTALDDAAFGASTLVVASDVTEERHFWPGDDGPSALLLRQGAGFGRTVSVDTALAAFVGACDGELTVSSITAALADLLEADPVLLAVEVFDRARALIDDGLLTPSE